MLFPIADIPTYRRPHPPESSDDVRDAVRLQWLGTAGVVIHWRDTTLLIDPYVSRLPLTTVLGRTLEPDRRAIMRWLPRADFVVAGHGHFDHLMDVPSVVLRDGATFVGSDSSARVLRARGVRESDIRAFDSRGGTVVAGDLVVTLVPSEHGRVLLGRQPLSGDIAGDFPRQARVADFRCGPMFGVHVRAGDVSVYHNGSAGLRDAALADLSADVLLLALPGSEREPDYVARVSRALKPRTIMPLHWDAFFSPLEEEPVRVLPGVDLLRFVREAALAAPAAAAVIPERLQQVLVTQDGRVRAARDEADPRRSAG